MCILSLGEGAYFLLKHQERKFCRNAVLCGGVFIKRVVCSI